MLKGLENRPGSEEGQVCFSVSKDCLADVTAKEGREGRQVRKVVSPVVLDEEKSLRITPQLISLPGNQFLKFPRIFKKSFLGIVIC